MRYNEATLTSTFLSVIRPEDSYLQGVQSLFPNLHTSKLLHNLEDLKYVFDHVIRVQAFAVYGCHISAFLIEVDPLSVIRV